MKHMYISQTLWYITSDRTCVHRRVSEGNEDPAQYLAE